MISPRIANAVIVIVTLVWVCSFVLSIVLPEYRQDPQIHVIFMALVGGSLALKSKRPNPNDNQ